MAPARASRVQAPHARAPGALPRRGSSPRVCRAQSWGREAGGVRDQVARVPCRGPEPTVPSATRPALPRPGLARPLGARPGLAGASAWEARAGRPRGGPRGPARVSGRLGFWPGRGWPWCRLRRLRDGTKGPCPKLADGAIRSSSRSHQLLGSESPAIEGSRGPLLLTLLALLHPPPQRTPSCSRGHSCSLRTLPPGRGVAVPGAQTSELQGLASPPGRPSTPAG